jgi:hypothetical protein
MSVAGFKLPVIGVGLAEVEGYRHQRGGDCKRWGSYVTGGGKDARSGG